MPDGTKRQPDRKQEPRNRQGRLAGPKEEAEHTKGRYEFPYGDFKNVHCCGVLTAESRAGQYKHYDIENAAAHLHGMIDAKREHKPSRR